MSRTRATTVAAISWFATSDLTCPSTRSRLEMAGPTANGMTTPVSNGRDDNLSRIGSALEVVHSPYSSNQSRQEAQGFLEEVKSFDEAPSHGFALASDKAQSPIVRHYSLSLLEHAVKHKWADYSPAQAGYLRDWVLQLSQSVSKHDPSYLRTKIAQLWVEVAKRSWAEEWMDMDELLLRLWQTSNSPVHKEFVLQILEMLSDDIFHADDSVVAMREGRLSKACVEIFTPAAILLQVFPNRQAGPNVRCRDEGWLERVSEFLNDCLSGDVQSNEDIRTCAVKAMAVLYSAVQWSIPKAIHAAKCVPYLCNGLAAPHVAVQKAALEVLHVLYSRTCFTEDEFIDLVAPTYNESFIDLSRRLFQSCTIDAQDIDDNKYQFAKKFSEMISCLGNYMERRFDALPGDANITAFLELLLLVVQSQSLVVSIPVLFTWMRLLGHRAIGSAAANTLLIGPLLELCSSRLIRFESLPEGAEDPTYILLLEDTDTLPERHAFLGNYRRYSCQVIENIVSLKLAEALNHILGQAESVLQSTQQGQAPQSASHYSKNSMTVLRVDARFTVVESALKGYMKWRSRHRSTEDLSTSAAIESEFESWCGRLLDMKIEDPLIRKRVLQLLVAFSTSALDKNTGFMLKVLEHILVMWPAPQPEFKAFDEAIKELQTESMVELQRLASKMPDNLLGVYGQLESKVRELIASGTLDDKRHLAYQSFLFIIIHRTTRLDGPTRVERLRTFVESVKAQWADASLKQALGSYDGFCHLMALDKAQKYLGKHRLHEINDWGSAALDGEGLALQSELEARQALLPLRATKSFLTYSVEKIEKDTPPYQASCVLWQDGFPTILPELLKFLNHAHASHNSRTWTNLPVEMQSIVGRVLTDRFWQAGISEGSKDDFFARVLDKKYTMEGMASSIRGAVRFVRETCYAIIYCMSRMDMQFYGFDELPNPLANALFADSACLSAHQIINLLNLVRYLVDNCPVELRGHFLPPLLATCFVQMDAKICTEWQNLTLQEDVRAAADELAEEMKAESILRQLTYTAVVMVADFLDPSRTNTLPDAVRKPKAAVEKYPSLRKFCLMNASVACPLLVFCKNAIGMHDTRCCGVVLRVLRSIVPEFHGPPPPAKEEDNVTLSSPVKETFPISDDTAKEIREFISTEVLKTAIQSLHDPYFVDSQKDLGYLIASILLHFSPLTQTPRLILLSLPNMKQEDVDMTIDYIQRPNTHSRQHRGLVLDLLKDLKGVSISEMGKLSKSFAARPSHGTKNSTRTKMAQEFMMPIGPTRNGDTVANRKSPDLDCLANMFNEGA